MAADRNHRGGRKRCTLGAKTGQNQTENRWGKTPRFGGGNPTPKPAKLQWGKPPLLTQWGNPTTLDISGGVSRATSTANGIVCSLYPAPGPGAPKDGGAGSRGGRARERAHV